MIRNVVELREVCASLRGGGLAALDTEFVWRNTYRPKLALVQLGAADGTSWAEDCLLALDTAPLAELLADAGTVKVLHDAHQDLDHLFHYTGAKPVNVFDTQLAAAFAGLPAGMSLQRLVQETVGVGLPKTETTTDWMQRPLTEAQIAYSLDDVRYLGEARAELLRRAEALGTRAWLEEEMRRYDDPSHYGDADPQAVWTHVKCGRARLDGRGFAVLRALAATRETLAREWNLPRTWLADDASLAEMAEAGESVAARLRFRHRLRNRGQRETLADAFAAAIREGLDVPEAAWPANPRPHYIAEVREAAEKALAFLRARAEEVHVDPAVVANRATLTAYVDNPEDAANPLARGWRFEVFGREIAERFVV
ncbi:MAG: ribonuclease D [Kiritimatiellia bacterium]